MPLELKIRKSPEATVVECSGRVVFGEETAYLRATVKDLLGQNPRVVLDFAQVRDIDSGGVGTLLGLLTSSVAAGGILKLARINKKVHQTLTVTRLTGILRSYDSVEQAVAAMPRDAEPGSAR